MQFIQQENSECLLAAVCQLHPNGKQLFNILRKGYDYTNPGKKLKYFASWLIAPTKALVIAGVTNPVENPIPTTGKGIVLLVDISSKLRRHAISYENGLLLDPQGPGKPETLEQLQSRMGSFWKVELIIPQPKETSPCEM